MVKIHVHCTWQSFSVSVIHCNTLSSHSQVSQLHPRNLTEQCIKIILLNMQGELVLIRVLTL